MTRPAGTVLLVNPNSSSATTATMAAVAGRALGPGYRVRAVTAGRGPALIVTVSELRASADDVLAAVRDAAGPPPDAVVVAAFGDPAVDELRTTTGVPTVGIAEAALREAAAGGRRFGVATTTPGLVDAIDDRVTAVGLRSGFRGIRLAAGDPRATLDDPDLLDARLADAVRDCVRLDHAECVVVGGGPLAAAAERLGPRVGVPLVAPVPAACRAVRRDVSWSRRTARG